MPRRTKLVSTKERVETRDEKYKKILLKKRAEALDGSGFELHSAVNGEGKLLSGDEGDKASDMNTDVFRQSRSSRHSRVVKFIDEALIRIEKGVYGVCDECNEEIPDARLEVYPESIRCRDCQEIYEASKDRGSYN